MIKLPGRLAALAALCAALTGPVCAAEQYVEYTGRALRHRTDRFAYGEHHFLVYRDGRLAQRLVLYTCRDGSPFARKRVDYVRPTAPDFLLEDAASGVREGVRESQGQRVMFFRARHDEVERTAVLPELDDLVIDAGFDQFIAAHWATLTGQGRMPMHFLVPSRREYLNFEVVHVRRETVAGVDCEVFRLKLAGVLGWLMSGIEVAYSRRDHILVRYEGLSDLRDAGGDNIAADISFDPAMRIISALEVGQAMRVAPIKACPSP